MELRQKLLDYIVETERNLIYDNNEEEFIKNLLLNGTDRTPLEELTDDELEALYHDMTNGEDWADILSQEWASNCPTEYDLDRAYGEEFPNE